MAARHVDALFSEAFDGRLDDADRHRFDEHLAGCAECRDRFADYTTALQAVHELPQARMPVAVVIPATAPQVVTEHRVRTWLRGLPARLARPGPAATGLGFAAVGIVAVVLAVHVGHGGGSPQTTAGGANLPLAAPAPAAGANGQGTSHTELTSPGCAFKVAAAPGGGAPEGFGNAVHQTDASRPGQQLVIATNSSSVHAGDHLTVYARLLTSGSDTAIVPCVSLVNASAVVPTLAPSEGQAPVAVAPANPGVPGQAAPASGPTAQPTTDGAAGTAPLLTVTIPAGVPPGTVLHLVAQVPADVPDAANGDLQAVLTITVS